MSPIKWVILGLAVYMFLPASAFSQVEGSIYASPQFEYDSNIFSIPSGEVLPGAGGRRGDTYEVYRGGLSGDYLAGQQIFYARLDGGEFQYQHFTQLNRNEYSIDGGWKWVLSRDLTGIIDVSRTRTMVPFNLLLDQIDTPVLQTSQREAASAMYQFNPNWRIDESVFENKTSSPLPAASQLNLQETSVSTTLTYTRNVKLTGGGRVAYISGKYEGGVSELAPSYHQLEVAGVANYVATGLSSFSGALGYTKRSAATGFNDVSSVTGSLDYKRALTGKTSMSLDVTRAVNANITNTGSEVDTSAGGSLTWQATYKLAVALAYTWTQRYLPGQNAPPTSQVAIGSDRTDHQQYVGLNLEHQTLRWLKVRGYYNYQKRSSNALDGSYDATVAGITVTATYGRNASSK